jgi:glycosyltransferase involved in cell wall biosynthesis
MVALEAMERARPVVAAEIGGLGELVVDGETGLLVPTAEAGPLAAALVKLAGDPALRRAMGEAGRVRALEHFAEHRNIERTELLYREYLNGSRPES